MTGGGLDLVLVWHMHQPDYRDLVTGEFRLPWVYLHALKDYSDMAAHLEQAGGARATVNFVPVLLDQLEDYADQFATGTLRDPLLRLLSRAPEPPLAADERALVLQRCFGANHEKMIAPYPAFRLLERLAAEARSRGPAGAALLSDAYYFDLLAWYHLAWTGESIRRGSSLPAELMAKETAYSHADRLALFALCAAAVAGIVPRYRALADSGRVELSTTPATHPLAPLLIDLACAREADPGVALPLATHYPGGRERAIAQLRDAIASHTRRFGRAPAGVWPAEGAISSDWLATLAGNGIRWTASGGAVLANSLRARNGTAATPSEVYRPYRLPDVAPGVVCFFRDDALSDQIGFEYARWHGDEAAASFVRQLETIADGAPGPERPQVTVILDGENAWEFYPYNGWYFLSTLYQMLSSHPRIRMLTPSGYLDAPDDRAGAGAGRVSIGELPRVVAGSWVNGNFATWIGSADKNRAWDLLCEAKQVFDRVVASGSLSRAEQQAATRQLAVCESSDWTWWFGDYNPAPAVASFDALYRANLAALYRRLGVPPPARLDEPVSRGAEGVRYEGAMRRAS